MMKVKQIAIYHVDNRISVYRQKKNAKGKFIRDKLIAEYNLELRKDLAKLAHELGDAILEEVEDDSEV